MIFSRISPILIALTIGAPFDGTYGLSQDAEMQWRSGVAKVEITPNEPLRQYTQRVENAIVDAISKAIDSQQRVRLRFGMGHASVSANRRVLENGLWKGFGKQADGIVDHRLGVMAIEDLNGHAKAIVYNYACHATTIPPTDNRVSGDWPGSVRCFA